MPGPAHTAQCGVRPEEVDDVRVADDGQHGQADQHHLGAEDGAQRHLLQGQVHTDELLHHGRHHVPHHQEEADEVGEAAKLAHPRLGHDGQVEDVRERGQEVREQEAAVSHGDAGQVGHRGHLAEAGPGEDQVGQHVAQHAHREDHRVPVHLGLQLKGKVNWLSFGVERH